MSVSYRDFNMRFFVSKVAAAEPTFHMSLCIIISPVQQNICGINSVSAFTLRVMFCSSFVPDARDADLRGANDPARFSVLDFKAILRIASKRRLYVTTVE